MTERMRLAELEHSSELAAQIQSTREDKQKRIARELHDDLGQQLTALKMGVAVLEAQLAASNTHPAALAATAGLQQQIAVMMASLRRLASNLRPPMLDDLGLGAALERLAEDFTHRYHFETVVKAGLDEASFTPSASTTIFRIVQEALTNVAKHAEARHVLIAISTSADTCTVRIEDDPRGTHLVDKRRPRSFGLLGMRERARQLGGFVQLASTPGSGFRIAVHLPLSAIQADDHAR